MSLRGGIPCECRSDDKLPFVLTRAQGLLKRAVLPFPFEAMERAISHRALYPINSVLLDLGDIVNIFKHKLIGPCSKIQIRLFSSEFQLK